MVGPIRRPSVLTSERTLGGGGLKQPGVDKRPHPWSSYVTRFAFSISWRACGTQLRADATESPKIVTCCSGGRLVATALAESAHATASALSNTTKRVTANNLDGKSAV